MKNIPVDTSRMNTMIGGAIQPATSPDGSPRRDATGRTLFNVPIIAVIDGSNAETFTVRVPGPVAQVPALTAVKLVALIARHWEMNGRSGVSFSAESVQPAGAVRS